MGFTEFADCIEKKFLELGIFSLKQKLICLKAIFCMHDQRLYESHTSKVQLGVEKMVPLVKALTALAEELGLDPSIHTSWLLSF